MYACNKIELDLVENREIREDLESIQAELEIRGIKRRVA
jgi:hypothetical protein